MMLMRLMRLMVIGTHSSAGCFGKLVHMKSNDHQTSINQSKNLEDNQGVDVECDVDGDYNGDDDGVHSALLFPLLLCLLWKARQSKTGDIGCFLYQGFL